MSPSRKACRQGPQHGSTGELDALERDITNFNYISHITLYYYERVFVLVSAQPCAMSAVIPGHGYGS